MSKLRNVNLKFSIFREHLGRCFLNTISRLSIKKVEKSIHEMEEYVVAALVDARERNYRERIRLESIRDVSNPFEMAEEKFKKIFRLPRSGAYHLINTLDDPRLHMGDIPKHIKILAALHFFSQGSYQIEVAQDGFMGLSQPTVSRCLTVTAAVIVQQLTPQHIKFPRSEAEMESAMRSFQELYQMPNTLGAVDGTHISIAKPPLSHPTAPGNIFYNRKGFYSINCQIVCSAKGKIIGMNPNFPGSTHDAAIWRSSKIYRFLRNAFIRGEQNQWLLGDKGYPLQPWLMTPLMEPSTQAEERYKEYNVRARNVVEMCNGRLKNKFRCLHKHRTLHYEPIKAANSADENQVIHEDIDDAGPYQESDADFLAQARLVRQGLMNRYFN